MCLSFSHGMMPKPSPTRFGPSRSCTHDATLRSSKIKYATVPSTVRWRTIVSQTQGGMCVEIQFILSERHRDKETKRPSALHFVSRSLRLFVSSYSLQLHKLKRRLGFMFHRQFHAGERLAHLGADIVGVV